jgi:hypothetical protein
MRKETRQNLESDHSYTHNSVQPTSDLTLSANPPKLVIGPRPTTIPFQAFSLLGSNESSTSYPGIPFDD